MEAVSICEIQNHSSQMNSTLVKLGQQKQKAINVHRPRSFLHEFALRQNPHDFLFDGKIFRQRDLFRFAVNTVVFLEDAQHGVRLKAGAQSLVFPREGDASQRIPF